MLFFAYAGYDITTIVIVATLGNWLGGISSYWLGYLGKWEWIERLLRIKKEKAQRTKNYLQSKGNIMAFFAFLPLVGDIIPLALGLLRTNFYVMAVIMALGKLFRYVVWVFLVMKMV
ncbi:MAG: hypothetical protein CSA05_03675 [Bacteroidia bacterium]|nr:MAG: hypothetical protein CSA05_03675 [Bacteroidia bacterium]